MTMNNMKHTRIIAQCTSLLVLVAFLATTLAVPAKAQTAAPRSSRSSKIEAHGHLTSTTGADLIRTQVTTNTYTSAIDNSGSDSLQGTTTTCTPVNNLLATIYNCTTTTTTSIDGKGIGIAILDSGVDVNHISLTDGGSKARIVFSQDFTGESRTDDPFGHGTHVASIATGNNRVASVAYTGIAPKANVINLRVLNAQGAGTVSSVLSALDWVMLNRAAYNVRVVNMSLGTPAINSYRDDPLCKAVRRLVDAGIVVTVAAGNDGKDSSGQKLYGRIHSPGNEPSAI